MKEEKRTRTYTADYTVYITEDGQEFNRYYDAVKYEKKLQATRSIEKHNILLSTEEENVVLYHLLSQEDYNYAKIIDWDNEVSNGFQGPGWYIVRHIDGGDYRDSYSLTKVDNYITSLEADLSLLKCLTKM